MLGVVGLELSFRSCWCFLLGGGAWLEGLVVLVVWGWEFPFRCFKFVLWVLWVGNFIFLVFICLPFWGRSFRLGVIALELW